MEDDIFDAFGLTPTADNQVLIHSIESGTSVGAAVDTLLQLLSIKASDEPKNMAPLETLYLGVTNGESAGNVLPKVGFTHHAYHEFLYDLAAEHPEL